MHQFTVEPIAKLFAAGGNEVWLTTSTVWMGAAAIILCLFMLGGMKRQLVPGRWQMAVEGFTGFVSSMMATNIGPDGRSEEHTSERQSLMRTSYAVFCLTKIIDRTKIYTVHNIHTV